MQQNITSEYHNNQSYTILYILIYNEIYFYDAIAITTPAFSVRLIPVGTGPDIHQQRDL